MSGTHCYFHIISLYILCSCIENYDLSEEKYASVFLWVDRITLGVIHLWRPFPHFPTSVPEFVGPLKLLMLFRYIHTRHVYIFNPHYLFSLTDPPTVPCRLTSFMDSPLGHFAALMGFTYLSIAYEVAKQRFLNRNEMKVLSMVAKISLLCISCWWLHSMSFAYFFS